MKRRIISAFLAILMVFSLLPVASATGTQTAILTVEQVYANPDKDVTVEIKIEDNPGILGATLTLSWEDGLELVDAENGAAFSALTMTPPSRYISGCNFVWFGSETGEIIDDTVLILTFHVKETATAEKNYGIYVTYESGDVLDGDYNTVEFLIENGSVWVITYLPGDVTGGKKINALDLVRLSQYISDGCKTDPDGYNVSINESAADVNGDGKINALDLVLISRYISDDCKTDPTGYNITLKPSTPKCSHTMQEVSYQAATCTKDGNIGYWYCTTCEKCFTAADGKTELSKSKTVMPATGHTPVTDPAVPPTTTSEGKTEGSHCSTCGAILVAQTTIPATQAKTHEVTYDIANGDPYLEKLLANGQISNANPQFYEEGSGLTLKNLSVAGYRFLGWYDLPQNGTLIKKIDTTATEDYELYAVWSKIEYTVQYKSSLFIERSSDTYTVDTGLVLPTPKLSNYIFTGWSDENGKLYSGTTIPVGSTGNLTLEGNWTSERNKTWTKRELDAPITYTEDNTLYFVYEIGEIQNVPLYTIKDFGYISEGGISKSETTTYAMTISESVAQQIAETVGKATTSSSNWSLSSGWSDVTSISEAWLEETGVTREEAESYAKNESSNWSISSGTSESTDTSVGSSNQAGWENEAKITSSKSETSSEKLTTEMNVSVSASCLGTKAEAGFNVGTEESNSTTSSSGFEVGGSVSGTQMVTKSTNTSSNWNTSSSFGASKSSTESRSLSTAISEKMTEQYGYGQSYTTNQTSGESQGLEQSVSGSKEWSNSVTYNTQTSEEVTRSWSTQATKGGYHRWIVAGTAHVFAVVGYDMATQSYFVYTYTVMDDETHEFEDYSYTTAAYNDHENGVISFEIPYEVVEMVAEQTTYSKGLKVDQETGIITGYTGTDNCVVIPEYMNVGNGDVVKITGIQAGAFAGNTDIAAVVLSNFITEIPDNCFNGCTSLERILDGSVQKIGNKAFYGCSSMQECAVRSVITSVGEQAFYGVGRAYFNCANASVAEAAANCGAKEIYIDLKPLASADELSGVELVIPSGTDFLSVTGDGSTYTDFTIKSDATETVLNKVNLNGTGSIPLCTSSQKVVLNQSSISSTGLALVLTAEECELSLQSTVTISSDNQNAILCKSLTLSEYNDNVDGRLAVNNRVLYVNTVQNTELATKAEYLKIDSQTFENMLHSFTLYFDADGGECAEASRTVANSAKIGALPTPTKEHYTFDGWFLSDGTALTENSVFSSGTDITVYAHWMPVPYAVTWTNATGCTISVSRTASPNANATLGELQYGATVYFGDVLNVVYTANNGFTLTSQGSTSVTVSGNVTNADIYAEASANRYTAQWSTGTGYAIAVQRTSSPYANAGTGTLASGDTVYYGDVLAITYTAKTGYSIDSKGKTSVTVTGNVDSNTIYATASANSYTYTIVYKSSNGTDLGSSSATYKFGTTNTITPPAKSGYTTPSAQSVAWNSTSKTIEFIYTPKAVTNSAISGVFVSSSPLITYSTTASYRNRTANSVEVQFTTTVSMQSGWYGYAYGVAVKVTYGSVDSGKIQIAGYNGLSSSGSSCTASTGWMTIPLDTTNATSLSFTGNLYNTDWQNNYVNASYYNDVYYTWTMNIPAY